MTGGARSRGAGAMAAAPFAAAIAAAVLAIAAGGCADVASTRDVRATVIDEEGTPVPGAIFYAEVRDAAGEPFAFEWRVAGAAGEIPDSAYRPLKLPWRPGARVAFAAFAPARRAAVLIFPDERPRTDGAVLTLPHADTAWNAELPSLAFPFEEAPELAARLAEAGAAADPLRAAFRAAWADRPESPPPTEAELRKLADLGVR